MHGCTAGSLVVQLTVFTPAQPAVGATFGDLQIVTDPTPRPASLDSLVEEREQPSLGGRVDSARDMAT
ncbi:MAG: hypothetical protein ACRDQZ_12215 [Mycobacteriales bacterium]